TSSRSRRRHCSPTSSDPDRAWSRARRYTLSIPRDPTPRPPSLEHTSGGSSLTVTDTNALVDELANRFWEKILELDPIQATILGDDRYDDRLPDLSPEGRAKEADLSRQVLSEAEAIGGDRLDTEQ